MAYLQGIAVRFSVAAERTISALAVFFVAGFQNAVHVGL